MFVNIEGKGRVFAKERDGWTSYTLGVSSKDKDGKWKNAYQPIRFKSGVNVPNGTDIEFKAFPTVKERTVDGQNRNYIVWQILEYVVEGEQIAEEAEEFTEVALPADYEPIQEGDIPF